MVNQIVTSSQEPEEGRECIVCGDKVDHENCNICDSCADDDPVTDLDMEFDQQNYCLTCDNFLNDDEVGRCQHCIDGP